MPRRLSGAAGVGQGEVGLESLRGVCSRLCCITGGIGVQAQWGLCLLHYIWGSHEGVSEGKRKWILEPLGRAAKSPGSSVWSAHMFMGWEWRKVQEVGGWGEEEQRWLNLTMSLWALKRGCEERLWQEVTLEEATPSEKLGVLLSEQNSFSKTEDDSSGLLISQKLKYYWGDGINKTYFCGSH